MSILNVIRNYYSTPADSPTTHVPVGSGILGRADVVIVHGWPYYYDLGKGPTPAEDIWIPGTAKYLRERGLVVWVPDMPNPFRPNYRDWKDVFEQFFVDERTVVVGHSCGAGFLLHYFSEPGASKVKKIILVAPWLNQFTGLTGAMRRMIEIVTRRSFPTDEEFFKFKILRELAGKTVEGVYLIRGSNDLEAIKRSEEMVLNAVEGVRVYTVIGGEHFLSEEIPPYLLSLVTSRP
jgi:pimeloyl-ACP methyl ester carboxylesterase